MNAYIFKTSATMKPYNNKKWWIDDGIIREERITAETVAAALVQYAERVKSRYYIEVTANALKSKQPMFINNNEGEPEQIGFVITAKTEFQNDCGRYSNQYIDLWVNIITTTKTIF